MKLHFAILEKLKILIFSWKKYFKLETLILNSQKIWGSLLNLMNKQYIISSIFRRKFIFDENGVRTEEMNEVICWDNSSSKAFEYIKKGQPRSKTELSRLVIPPGFEPRS